MQKFRRFKLIKLKYNDLNEISYFGWETLPPLKSEYKLLSESNFNEDLEQWENSRILLKPESNGQHDKIVNQIKTIFGEYDTSSLELRYKTALKEGVEITEIVEVRRYHMLDRVRLKEPVYLLVYKEE